MKKPIPVLVLLVTISLVSFVSADKSYLEEKVAELERQNKVLAAELLSLATGCDYCPEDVEYVASVEYRCPCEDDPPIASEKTLIDKIRRLKLEQEILRAAIREYAINDKWEKAWLIDCCNMECWCGKEGVTLSFSSDSIGVIPPGSKRLGCYIDGYVVTVTSKECCRWKECYCLDP